MCNKNGNTKHGMFGTPTYKSWGDMLSRCRNANNPAYARYSDKGYSKDWEKFENFFADMGERPEGMTLDRKDGSKGYYKENCRWATPQQQAENRKSVHWLTFKGKTMTLAAWARELGIPKTTMHRKIVYKGLTLEQICN